MDQHRRPEAHPYADDDHVALREIGVEEDEPRGEAVHQAVDHHAPAAAIRDDPRERHVLPAERAAVADDPARTVHDSGQRDADPAECGSRMLGRGGIHDRDHRIGGGLRIGRGQRDRPRRDDVATQIDQGDLDGIGRKADARRDHRIAPELDEPGGAPSGPPQHLTLDQQSVADELTGDPGHGRGTEAGDARDLGARGRAAAADHIQHEGFIDLADESLAPHARQQPDVHDPVHHRRSSSLSRCSHSIIFVIDKTNRG